MLHVGDSQLISYLKKGVEVEDYCDMEESADCRASAGLGENLYLG